MCDSINELATKPVLTANEANFLANYMNTEKNNQQMNDVMREISEAARDGNYHVNIYFDISAAVQNALEDLGYSVKHEMHMNEVAIMIFWKTEEAKK